MNATTSRSIVVSMLVPILALLGLILLTLPVWRWLWGEWMGNDYYSHGILILPVSLFLVYQRFRHDPSLTWPPTVANSRDGSIMGILLIAGGMLLYLLFLNNRAFYLAAFAVIILIAGLVWTLAGTHVFLTLLFPIGYLALMIPLPFIERWTYPLAMFTGVCSGGLVQFLGLDIKIVGNAVTLPNADLIIGAQCSGINSLIALTSLTILAAYLLEGPLWGRLLLVAFSIPLALLGNIFRVASLLGVARQWGGDAAFTFYHDYSGPIFFVVILLLMVPIMRLLHCNSLRPEVI